MCADRALVAKDDVARADVVPEHRLALQLHHVAVAQRGVKRVLHDDDLEQRLGRGARLPGGGGGGGRRGGRRRAVPQSAGRAGWEQDLSGAVCYPKVCCLQQV